MQVGHYYSDWGYDLSGGGTADPATVTIVL